MISVVIPSRLATMPDGRLWLERAVESVGKQIIGADHPIEVIVGLDSGAQPPGPLRIRHPDARASAPRGQAAALNAALGAASGDYIAILEDDDWWEAAHLQLAVTALADFEFVSSSQRVVDPLGTHLGVLGFPTPSGWVMPRGLLDKVGPFDQEFRLHLDNEWLARLNRAVRRRGHFVESTGGDVQAFLAKRPDLARPAELSLLAAAGRYTQVVRTRNPEGGLERSRSDPALKARSALEYEQIRARYGPSCW